MPRTLSHQWVNRKPFTRRVRWYAAGIENKAARETNIKLVFEDAEGEVRLYYDNNPSAAQFDWNRFKGGEPTSVLRNNQTKAV